MSTLVDQLRDRIEELEDMLRVSPDWTHGYRILGITGNSAKVLGLLMKRDVVSREQIFTLLYDEHQHDKLPEFKIVDQWIFRIREGLKPHGIKIFNNYKQGFYMDLAGKKKLREVLKNYLPVSEHA